MYEETPSFNIITLLQIAANIDVQTNEKSCVKKVNCEKIERKKILFLASNFTFRSNNP